MSNEKAIKIETLATELASLARYFRASNDEKETIIEEMRAKVGLLHELF